uniref:Si:ch211-114l13.12 n=1 Tax=Cyprinus carpio TaxID=7962 RepID=A0A8C1UEU8_CYPCA
MSGSSERNEERVVTVSISNVSVRDAGVYWCGAETRDTYLTFISLNTKIQLNLIIHSHDFTVVNTVYSQSFVLNVCIICSYDSIYKSKPKSLCKGKCSTRDRNPLSETRFSLTDNKTAHIFTVTITDLRTEDQGQYWCGVETGWRKLDVFTEIHLEIKRGQEHKNKWISVTDLNISAGKMPLTGFILC